MIINGSAEQNYALPTDPLGEVGRTYVASGKLAVDQIYIIRLFM